MPSKDLHAKPFDEGTITKLEIFENYAKEWLPTFVMSPHKELWIFDFFAGTGYDKNNIEGSPIRILKQVKNQIGNIFNKKTKINICLNELEKEKFQQLEQACNNYICSNTELNRAKENNLVNIYYYNKDFDTLFPQKLSIIKQFPSLVYLDQNGIKFINYIDDLAKTKTTDFLYYLSSSFFIRFGQEKSFKSVIDVDIELLRNEPYNKIHKNILEKLRTKLPQNTELKLYPFTIRKKANVYGIIFGATHIRAVDKFLKVAWNKNSINGEANFDIDDDRRKSQLDLFVGQKLNKIETFKQHLQREILEGKIKTNKEAYHYTLLQGHISKHASDKVKQMKKEGLIIFSENSPLINYEQIFQKKRIIKFEINNRK
jgi:three-Cys-motif partner protein